MKTDEGYGEVQDTGGLTYPAKMLTITLRPLQISPGSVSDGDHRLTRGGWLGGQLEALSSETSSHKLNSAEMQSLKRDHFFKPPFFRSLDNI